jgi:hypothetical protein
MNRLRHTTVLILATLLMGGFAPFQVDVFGQQASSNGEAGENGREATFSRLSRIPPRRIHELYERLATSATDIVVSSSVPMYARPASTRPIARLRRGDLVHRVLRKDDWSAVRTVDGRIGYVENEALSDTWILIAKEKQKVYVYKEETLLESFNADLAVNPAGDKEQRGGFSNPDQRRTPEGLFFISKQNPNSKFHRALVINYPTPIHAERGLKSGLISRSEYAEIVKAEMTFRSPPMTTRLGGWIEIHGSGVQGTANWTDGCIALGNSDMDRLYEMVGVGTPVLIIP